MSHCTYDMDICLWKARNTHETRHTAATHATVKQLKKKKDGTTWT